MFAAFKRQGPLQYLFPPVYNKALIARSSRKQQTVATSTAESEYISAAVCTKEVMFFKSLLSELIGDRNRLCSAPQDMMEMFKVAPLVCSVEVVKRLKYVGKVAKLIIAIIAIDKDVRSLLKVLVLKYNIKHVKNSLLKLEMSGLRDKVVVITGASSGIGAGTAVHFASLGCKLVIAGRNEENLKGVSQKCLENGLSADKVVLLIGDVTDEAFCEKLVKHTVNTFGKIDVLVNSAGILVTGGIEQIDMKDFDRQMDVNVRSIFLLTKLALPHILATKGNIVNVSSVTGMRSFPGVVAYNMSKAAVDHFTRSVALEVASRGVRVNAVNPGVIVTECHKRAGMNDEDYAKFLEHSKSTHALGRPGTVDEVARAVAFLASEDASFITGHTLPVDGGRNIMCPR